MSLESIYGPPVESFLYLLTGIMVLALLALAFVF